MLHYHNKSEKFDLLFNKTEALIISGPDAAHPASDILSLINELKIYQAELEIQNEELKRAQRELADIKNDYEKLYELAPCGYLNLDPKGLIVRVNQTGAMMLNDHPSKARQRSFSRYIDPAFHDSFIAALRSAGQTGEKQRIELRLLKPDNPAHAWVMAEILAERSDDDTVNLWFVTLTDISAAKEMEQLLKKARADEQEQAKKRSAELCRKNEQLGLEIKSHKKTWKKLSLTSRRLKEQSGRLKEANSAVKVLLKEHEKNRLAMEEKVRSSIEMLIRPHLESLKEGLRSPRQKVLVDLINTTLDDIVSPLSRRLIIEGNRLTSKEMAVAGLIRQGKTTKEIAALMGVEASTIDFHRANIRRKFNLTNSRINLAVYLKSLL